jgi:hypothetical protein
MSPSLFLKLKTLKKAKRLPENPPQETLSFSLHLYFLSPKTKWVSFIFFFLFMLSVEYWWQLANSYIFRQISCDWHLEIIALDFFCTVGRNNRITILLFPGKKKTLSSKGNEVVSFSFFLFTSLYCF